MFVLELESGKLLKAKIERAGIYDLVSVNNDKKRYSAGFFWSRSKDTEIYKLRLENKRSVLGLMSIRDEKDSTTRAIKIELLEIDAENIGSKKKMAGTAGCLIAWACKISFERGYEGIVYLVPKTNLITHFTSAYGFIHVDIRSAERPLGFMILLSELSQKLINRFLTPKNE
jgi:hypothetical protein